MDVDMPVWTIRPNWKGGVLERLEWLTDVLASDSGVEQRRSVRLSPRRSFEITVNPTRQERSYLDLILHRLGSEEWLFPLWHDQARLTEKAVAGAQALMFDNLFREFRDGDLAILYADAFTWEVVQIESQDAGGATLSVPLDAPWPERTKLFPLRVCSIQTETTLKALTSRVGESVILFQINDANDYPEAIGDDMVIYQGTPLLTRAPDWSQGIDTSHTRLFDEQDGDIGLRYRTDSVNRAFAVQSHNWQVTGREAQSSFRSFLYTLRGRQRKVWLPTYGDDVILAQPVAAGATNARIENIGYRYVGAGSPIPGRSMLWTGEEVVRIAAVPAPTLPQEERFNLLAPLTAEYDAGASWAFLQAARLDQDMIEIHHNADSDGTFEVGAGFKTLADDRDGSGINFVPIPITPKTVGECGAPAGSNPCKHIPFDGIYMTIIGSSGSAYYCNPQWDGNRDVSFTPARPNGPNGKRVTGGSIGSSAAPGVNELYENNNPGLDPALQGQLLLRITNYDFNNWKMEFFFPVEGPFHVHIFPSARYCGSASTPKDNDGYGRLAVSATSIAGLNFSGERVAGGNTDSDWDF